MELTTPMVQRLLHRACLLEATARKPGNVHPAASFADLSYRDLVVSAEVSAPILAHSRERGIGPAVLEATRKTQAAVGKNTNLGILLLLAPLAAIPAELNLEQGIAEVLNGLTREDALAAYQAIRLAQPGGLGTASQQDVSREPTGTLLDVMRLAQNRDWVAAQYANQFDLVLNTGLPFLTKHEDFPRNWQSAVIDLHLRLMADWPDSLIARKCGWGEAFQAAKLARDVLDAGWPHSEESQQKWIELDCWLRQTGHRRNPGTTADLVTACLFAALRDGWLEPPTINEIANTAGQPSQVFP